MIQGKQNDILTKEYTVKPVQLGHPLDQKKYPSYTSGLTIQGHFHWTVSR